VSLKLVFFRTPLFAAIRFNDGDPFFLFELVLFFVLPRKGRRVFTAPFSAPRVGFVFVSNFWRWFVGGENHYVLDELPEISMFFFFPLQQNCLSVFPLQDVIV